MKTVRIAKLYNGDVLFNGRDVADLFGLSAPPGRGIPRSLSLGDFMELFKEHMPDGGDLLVTFKVFKSDPWPDDPPEETY